MKWNETMAKHINLTIYTKKLNFRNVYRKWSLQVWNFLLEGFYIIYYYLHLDSEHGSVGVPKTLSEGVQCTSMRCSIRLHCAESDCSLPYSGPRSYSVSIFLFKIAPTLYNKRETDKTLKNWAVVHKKSIKSNYPLDSCVTNLWPKCLFNQSNQSDINLIHRPHPACHSLSVEMARESWWI